MAAAAAAPHLAASKPAVSSATASHRHVIVSLCPRVMPCCRHRANNRHRITTSSSSGAGGGGYAPSDAYQENDLMGGVLDSCLRSAARITDTAVSRLADVLQTLAPPDAPRHKIEVSVKGALVLLLLGLLKGVISFVLLVGCVGLAGYTATQVFGWNAFLFSRSSTFGGGYDTRQQQQQQQYYHTADQGPYQPGQAPNRQQQQQRPGARPHPRRRPPFDQGDVVDVFHFSQPGAP